VTDVANKLIGKLSKGYRAEGRLAQAIIHNPEVLILDEPTAGLDPKQIHETRGPDPVAGGPAHDPAEHAHPERSRADVRHVIIISKGQVWLRTRWRTLQPAERTGHGGAGD